jgi:single-stranded-DNA-specific exonuclease
MADGNGSRHARVPLEDAIRCAADITGALGIPDIIARILVARGITTPDAASIFLRPRLGDLSDPFHLPDMKKGIMRIVDAIAKGEKICIWGDYDADGISSIALAYNFLKNLGIIPAVHIPTREEGYGLHSERIEGLRQEGVSLLVSVDCGSSNAEEIARAKELGIDTIVIDHHEIGADLPPACAVINPKRKDSAFPTRDLAACGVTFFFLMGLRRTLHKKGLISKHINLKKELDLVTVGTVGDMVPLTGDNRILVRHGMEVMNEAPRAWLRSMLGNKIISKGLVNEFALGFIIVPRINAAGRVSSPDPSFHFLVSPDDATALPLLAALQRANSDRQGREKKIHDQIVRDISVNGLGGRKTIVVFDEKWQEQSGVLGIVAQKLTEQFGKPAIVMTKVKGVWKGSGRGGDGMDLFETICSLSPLLLKYGGHKYACGISVAEGNIELFADAFERSVEGPIVFRTREAHVDTAATLDELTTGVMEFLEQMGPFGIGNPRPNLLIDVAGIQATDKGFAKITDHTARVWDGFYPGKGPVKKNDPTTIIALPSVRMRMGEKFINLSVKKIIEE